MGILDMFKKKPAVSAFPNKTVSAPQSSKYEPLPSFTPKVENKYDFYKFNVAGVTFKNGRKTRQAILRKIKFRDEPFTKEVDINISKYEFEGEPALGVYANSEQIGNVPKEKVQYLLDNWDRVDSITAIDITGGGSTPGGEPLSYGAVITIRLNK